MGRNGKGTSTLDGTGSRDPGFAVSGFSGEPYVCTKAPGQLSLFVPYSGEQLEKFAAVSKTRAGAKDYGFSTKVHHTGSYPQPQRGNYRGIAGLYIPILSPEADESGKVLQPMVFVGSDPLFHNSQYREQAEHRAKLLRTAHENSRDYLSVQLQALQNGQEPLQQPSGVTFSLLYKAAPKRKMEGGKRLSDLDLSKSEQDAIENHIRGLPKAVQDQWREMIDRGTVPDADGSWFITPGDATLPTYTPKYVVGTRANDGTFTWFDGRGTTRALTWQIPGDMSLVFAVRDTPHYKLNLGVKAGDLANLINSDDPKYTMWALHDVQRRDGSLFPEPEPGMAMLLFTRQTLKPTAMSIIPTAADTPPLLKKIESGGAVHGVKFDIGKAAQMFDYCLYIGSDKEALSKAANYDQPASRRAGQEKTAELVVIGDRKFPPYAGKLSAEPNGNFTFLAPENTQRQLWTLFKEGNGRMPRWANDTTMRKPLPVSLTHGSTITPGIFPSNTGALPTNLDVAKAKTWQLRFSISAGRSAEAGTIQYR